MNTKKKLTEALKQRVLFLFCIDCLMILARLWTDIEVVITTLGLTDTFCHESAQPGHSEFQASKWRNIF